jgi:hypothetical protein
VKRTWILGVGVAIGLALLAVVAGRRATERKAEPGAVTLPADAPDAAAAATAPADRPGYLYGRVVTESGAVYEGRLRFGGRQEAFWSDAFNGVKAENVWAAHAPLDRLKQRRPISILGFEIAHRERPIDLGRPFVARFGDLGRIESLGRDVRVTLKSGTVLDLDRLDASDFDDGVRVWDRARGVVDLDSLRIRTVELLPTPRLASAPGRLHGTVRTLQGEFTGFVQWDREACVGNDELRGRTAEGEIGLRFDAIRSIARRSRDGALVSLVDGRELELSGERELGPGNRGIAVDDPRYGWVRVGWDDFERLDLRPAGEAGSGPGYADFAPGRPLAGVVTTRDGRRMAGRLVYDLDESETTDTLDAPARGADFTLAFDRIAAIVLPDPGAPADAPARVTLRDGEELPLERTGDLGEDNLGLLIFPAGRERADYVPWIDVRRIDLER